MRPRKAEATQHILVLKFAQQAQLGQKLLVALLFLSVFAFTKRWERSGNVESFNRNRGAEKVPPVHDSTCPLANLVFY